jgi:hypothetical protein
VSKNIHPNYQISSHTASPRLPAPCNFAKVMERTQFPQDILVQVRLRFPGQLIVRVTLRRTMRSALPPINGQNDPFRTDPKNPTTNPFRPPNRTNHPKKLPICTPVGSSGDENHERVRDGAMTASSEADNLRVRHRAPRAVSFSRLPLPPAPSSGFSAQPSLLIREANQSRHRLVGSSGDENRGLELSCLPAGNPSIGSAPSDSQQQTSCECAKRSGPDTVLSVRAETRTTNKSGTVQ